jgi:MGT family glycosyltransferase
LPFSGHTNPTLGLAKALVDMGCEVTYIHAPSWKEKIQLTGAAFVPYDDYPAECSGLYWEYRSFGTAISTVMRIGHDYDVLVYEFLFYRGKCLADKLGVPAVRLFSTFALNRTILDEFSNSGGTHFTAFARFPSLNRFLSGITSKKYNLEPSDGISDITDNIPARNYVYTIREFQIHSDSFPEEQFKFVGPSIWSRQDCMGIPYDELKKPIVYISLGTMLNNSISFFKKCIRSFANEDISVIISIGSKFPVDKLGSSPNNIMIYQHVPQLEVLQNADLFITHGGMNSVNESLYYGVPMVVVPRGNDQPTVGKRVAELKLGVMIEKNQVTADSLRIAAYTVINNVEYRENAKKMQNSMIHAGGNTLIASDIINLINNK